MLLDNQEVIEFQGLFLGVFSFLIKSATLSRTAHRNIQRLGAHMNGDKKRKKKALTTDSPCLPAYIFISGNLIVLPTMQRGWRWKLETAWTWHDDSQVSRHFPVTLMQETRKRPEKVGSNDQSSRSSRGHCSILRAAHLWKSPRQAWTSLKAFFSLRLSESDTKLYSTRQ